MSPSHNSILISACLLGEKVRYDGRIRKQIEDNIRQWQLEKRLIPICPEVAGGLSVPRPPAEVANGVGWDVLCGKSGVVDVDGRSVTKAFIEGAQEAWALALKFGAGVAVLKDGSPSCGVTYIYDGSFSRQCIPGRGVTTALLQKKGIKVYSERELHKVDVYLSQLRN